MKRIVCPIDIQTNIIHSSTEEGINEIAQSWKKYGWELSNVRTLLTTEKPVFIGVLVSVNAVTLPASGRILLHTEEYKQER